MRKRFATVLGRFRREGLARSVLLLAGSAVFSQVISGVASPILTRIYTPADFGQLAVFAGIASLLVSIGSMRYHMAVPLPEDDATALNLLALCGVLLLASSTVLLLLLPQLRHLDVSRWNAPTMWRHIWLLPVGVLCAGTYQAATYWGVRNEEFKTIAWSRVQQSLTQAVTQITIGILSTGPIGLIIGYCASQANGTRALLRSAWRVFRTGNVSLTTGGLVTVAKRYFRFAVFGTPSALLIDASASVTPILLASMYGASTAGLFALTQRIMIIPMRLLGQAVGQTFMGAAAKLIRDEPERVGTLFARSARHLAIIGALSLIPVAIVAPSLFGIVFGGQWREAGTFVRWMTPLFLGQLIVSPLSPVVFLVERQDLEMYGSLLRLIAVLLFFYVAHRTGMSARHAVAGYSLVMAGCYAGFFVFYRSLARGKR